MKKAILTGVGMLAIIHSAHAQQSSCSDVIAATKKVPQLMIAHPLPPEYAGLSAQDLIDQDYYGWKAGSRSEFNWSVCTPQEIAANGIVARNVQFPPPLSPPPVAPAPLPLYDVDRNCLFYKDQTAFNFCHNSEQQGYDALQIEWQAASDHTRTYCINLVSDAGEKHYTQLVYSLLEKCVSELNGIDAERQQYTHSQPFQP